MIGAFVGDINGSWYEFGNSPKTKNFELWQKRMYYTDDSICTLAVMKTLMMSCNIDYSSDGLKIISKRLIDNFKIFYNLYPNAGFGSMFAGFCRGDTDYKPYNSFGNGAAMRVSPVGWIARSTKEVKLLSNAVTRVTHNHEEGLKGAEATAMCIYFARKGKTKEYIKQYVKSNYYPNIDKLNYDELVKNYTYDITCQGTVPVAIYCFLISNSFEDCIRTFVSIGGDADTLGAIAMSIAEAYYYDKEDLSIYENKVYVYMDEALSKIIKRFKNYLQETTVENKIYKKDLSNKEYFDLVNKITKYINKLNIEFNNNDAIKLKELIDEFIKTVDDESLYSLVWHKLTQMGPLKMVSNSALELTLREFAKKHRGF